jgi:hypothetical protein
MAEREDSFSAAEIATAMRPEIDDIGASGSWSATSSAVAPDSSI